MDFEKLELICVPITFIISYANITYYSILTSLRQVPERVSVNHNHWDKFCHNTNAIAARYFLI